MRQPNNKSRRPRGGRRPTGRQNFDSNGPGVRIRGSAAQVYDKYVALARDASTSGDRVLAENMLQHAEHYHRIMNPDGAAPARPPQPAQDDFTPSGAEPDNPSVAGEERPAPRRRTRRAAPTPAPGPMPDLAGAEQPPLLDSDKPQAAVPPVPPTPAAPAE